MYSYHFWFKLVRKEDKLETMMQNLFILFWHWKMFLLQRETSDTFQGFIRVYMNLMRPISMSLTARPPSIYDVLTPDPDSPDSNSDTQTTSFYLPKDTTKVIHITRSVPKDKVMKFKVMHHEIFMGSRCRNFYSYQAENLRGFREPWILMRNPRFYETMEYISL